jgi:hemin uptake protein HemP
MNMKPAKQVPVPVPSGPASTGASGTPERQAVSPSGAARFAGPQTLDSRELLGNQTLVLIQHGDEVYRLQATRQGKLILTK